jgi:predicted 3-demethylubiquinone-9 3-methyltransferase (glyoxalase superfamily)
MSKEIYPCLWFENNAKEALNHYCSIFKSAKIVSENPIVIILELNGSRFMLLNGRAKFEFNESVSFVVECDTQAEIDHYWNNLSKGGSEGQCGWLKDKYGVSWQIVPTILGKLMSDPSKSQKVIEAFMKMKKFDIQKLIDAAA